MPGTFEKTIIEELNERIADNCTSIDTDERYDAMLDEIYSLEKVGGLFASMCASRVLKEVDPVAYRCGKNDWSDGEDFVDVDGDAYDKSDADAQREELISELDSEIEDLQAEIDEAEEGDEMHTEKAHVADLKERRGILSRHDWSGF